MTMDRTNLTPFFGAGILALLMMHGCIQGDGEAIRLWVSAQDSDAGAWMTPDQTVNLWAARNETISMRVSFEADRLVNAPSVRINHDTPKGSAPVISTEVYRIGEIHIGRAPEWQVRSIPSSQRRRRVPDVLIPIDAPRGGLPPSLSRGESLDLWIDIAVSKEAAGGTHRFEVQLTDGGRAIEDWPVAVTVWPFTLPDLPKEALLAGVISRHDSVARDLRGSMQLLRAHKLTPIIIDAHPEFEIVPPGDARVNWLDYDRIVEPFVLGDAYTPRRPAAFWPIPYDERFPPPPDYEPQESPTYAAAARSYLVSAADHFERRGWLDRSFVTIPFVASPPDDAAHNEEIIEYFTSLISDADPRIRVVAPLPPDAMPVNLQDAVDVWSPPAQQFDPTRMTRQRQLGRRTWFKISNPPHSGTTELCNLTGAAEILPWQARRYDAEAVDLGIINDWPDGSNVRTPQQIANASPSTLIYPGGVFGLSRPVESIRLKQLRRGMQDLGYLDLLRDAGLSHVADSVMESICRFAMKDADPGGAGDGRSIGWPVEAEIWSEARRIMADALLRARGGEQADKLRETLQWQQFMGRTREVILTTQGVRLYPSEREGFAYRIEWVIRVVNGGRRPIRGTLSVNPLPTGWLIEQDSAEVDRLGENESAVARLIVYAPTLPPLPDGRIDFDVLLRDQLEQEHTSHARLAVQRAVPLQSPMTIDGKPDDWTFVQAPPASDFQIDDQADIPARATTFYAAHDGENLYMLFDAAKTTSNPNDSLELLIDPIGTGTRKSSTLQSVQLFPNGEWQAKGLNDANGIEYMSTADQGHWLAEISIPLSQIDSSGARRKGIIAFDVIRRDADTNQTSRWAGNVHNWDQPISLGNLLLGVE